MYLHEESSAMSRSQNKLSIPTAITVVAVAVIALIASGVLRPSPVTGVTPTPSPTAPASPAPASPTPPADPAPTPVPTPVDDLSDGVKSVRLDIATPHEVVAEIKDFTGHVSDAKSGRAGDGMSVRWYDLKVENVDDDSLRLTWVGLPNDDPVKVVVTDLQGEPTIVVMQLMPPSDSDALGFDRVLDLDFDGPVVAEDFATLVQDGWDTAS
jgi:hypothetical protein